MRSPGMVAGGSCLSFGDVPVRAALGVVGVVVSEYPGQLPVGTDEEVMK